MAARQEAVTRRSARAFPRLPAPCAVLDDVAETHPPRGTLPQPKGYEPAARAPQCGAPRTETRAVGMPPPVDSFAQIAPTAAHTAPGPRNPGPGGPLPHAAAWPVLRAAVLVLAFALRRLAPGARNGSPAGCPARSGPAPFPGAFLISPPLVLRA